MNKTHSKLLVRTAKAFVKSRGHYTAPVEKCYQAARASGLASFEALRLVNTALYAFQNGGLVR